MRSFKAARPAYARQEISSLGSSDAVFTDDSTQSFGLADGVGSWKAVGLDPGVFAEDLMKNTNKVLTQHYSELAELKSKDVGEYLIEVLSMAFDKVHSFGSATATLGICFRSRLITANLGDSTVIVLRQTSLGKLRVVFRTKEMQHSLNCPFQLCRLPRPKQYRDLTRKGYGLLVKYLQEVKDQVQDTPEAAQIYSVSLQLNDLVIVGTDGLFDNLLESTIVEHAEAAWRTWSDATQLCKQLSEKLTSSAVTQSFRKDYMSPFAVAAKKARKAYVGGKPDDVTVCVGVLTN
jgi:protein phosphatase PTC7